MVKSEEESCKFWPLRALDFYFTLLQHSSWGLSSYPQLCKHTRTQVTIVEGTCRQSTWTRTWQNILVLYTLPFNLDHISSRVTTQTNITAGYSFSTCIYRGKRIALRIHAQSRWLNAAIEPPFAVVPAVIIFVVINNPFCFRKQTHFCAAFCTNTLPRWYSPCRCFAQLTSWPSCLYCAHHRVWLQVWMQHFWAKIIQEKRGKRGRNVIFLKKVRQLSHLRLIESILNLQHCTSNDHAIKSVCAIACRHCNVRSVPRCDVLSFFSQCWPTCLGGAIRCTSCWFARLWHKA